MRLDIHARRAGALLALLALAATACSDAAAPTAPDAPSLAKGGPKTMPTNGRIYFVSDVGGTHDIYSMNPDGSDRRRVTSTADYEGGLDVSRDGRKLVFAAQRPGGVPTVYDIFTMNVDGSNRRLLLTVDDGQAGGPRFSPDGRTIAFGRKLSTEAVWGIWTMSASGGGVKRITPAEVSAGMGTWSSDGQRLAYVNMLAGGAESDLHVMNADGSGSQLLFDCEIMCLLPQWSYDGSRLYFYGLVTVDGVSGSGMRYCDMTKVPAHCTSQLLEPMVGKPAVLSPDGSQLAYHTYAGGAPGSVIGTANANGSAQTVVTGNLGFVDNLVWGR